MGWRVFFNYRGNINTFVMVNFFSEYWEAILAAISAPVAWFFGGRAKQRQDAVSTMKTMYDDFLLVYQSRMNEVMQEVTDLKKHNLTLQREFNDIQKLHAKELQKSQKLAKDYEQLKGLYDRLKTDFDNYKKLK